MYSTYYNGKKDKCTYTHTQKKMSRLHHLLTNLDVFLVKATLVICSWWYVNGPAARFGNNDYSTTKFGMNLSQGLDKVVFCHWLMIYVPIFWFPMKSVCFDPRELFGTVSFIACEDPEIDHQEQMHNAAITRNV